ncbi:class F sortase [Jatrophihabitans telluris]|uniref:Class F sortase n=1 Tax=Jatrophihabitans telluris TaxID=2038343 RepID=A0ABY4QVJ8_9ACTN|nr:class F sortase [Jatrophihabitans telluris]UQX87066.1 class F sortase [Jatrophihabitans telluris]
MVERESDDPAFPEPLPATLAPSRLRRRRALVGLAGVLAITGAAAVVVGLTGQQHAPRPSNSAQAAPLPSPSTIVPTSAGSSPPRQATTKPTPLKIVPKPTVMSRPALPPVQAGLSLASSPPVELTIPAIGVDTTLMNLGLNPDSTVQTPPLSRNSIAGWYELSATPGSLGASVMLGHVDSAAYGAGVFYRLGALNPGDHVDVRRQDGTVAVFRVDRVAEYPKSQFPTALVYGQTSYSALRLVTCGGSFDTTTGNYRDNIIAFASLVSSHHA